MIDFRDIPVRVADRIADIILAIFLGLIGGYFLAEWFGG
jgi:hypothetical protein